MTNLNTADPCFIHPRHFGSLPFYHIDTFEDLCQFLLFPYVEVQKRDGLCFVDLQAKPSGLFLKPSKIGFMLPESVPVPDDIEMIHTINQSDQVQGQSPAP